MQSTSAAPAALPALPYRSRVQQWEDEAERQAAVHEEAEGMIDASELLEELEVNFKAQHTALIRQH